ncbi:UNVERIFIED_CONTAM: hypothetical protein Sradi_1864700 [Sesamum radiatum]|uniref:Uncharacterized protein n=1 Tax=Sesamum radiatum TaxID=300843 RepID=A0AAW2TWZ1_SESRA
MSSFNILSITVALYFGGEFVHVPEAKYMGGRVKKFDYVNATILNKFLLDHYCGMAGIGERRNFYIIMNKGFKLLIDDNDIKVHALKYVGDELKVFVEVETEVMGVSEQPVEIDKGKKIMETEHEGGDNVEDVDELWGYDSILDSDYDMEDENIDDDDLFEKYVDDEGDMLRDDTLSREGGQSENDSGEEDVVDSDDDLNEKRLSDEDRMCLHILCLTLWKYMTQHLK